MFYNWENYIAVIAEDDPMNFRLIEALLNRRTKIHTIWAQNGVEAYEQCRDNPDVDILLLDLQLPEMNGLTVLELIKKEHPRLPVIIQTANTWNNEKQHCIEAGCNAFMTKPLNIDDLLSTMNTCLEVYSLHK